MTSKKTKKANSRKRSQKSRKYEGASKSKRLSRWISESTSANTEIQGSLTVLRNRARDLRRNNPYAARGVQAITSNTVGCGISTQFRASGDVQKLEDLWAKWAETTAIDFDGRNNIYGLQRLALDAVVESGEVLVRKRFTAGLSVPLQYQVLESDFIDTTQVDAKTDKGNTIVQGIEFDSQGKRVAYWLFEQHPGSYDPFFRSTLKSTRVPVDEVYHIYRMERPGQARGIPWLAPVIVRLKDLDDYEDAQLLRQKIAACFTAFIKDMSGEFAEDDDEDCEEVELAERIEPGLIEELPRGKEVQFSNPPEVQNYGQYVGAVLRAVAAGLGVTYEVLANDYSQVNFSSGRMGWIEFSRNIKSWQDHIIYPHMLDPIAKDFLATATILGIKTDGVGFVHVPPKREMIDPTKEIPATVDAIRAGLTTLSDEVMALGKDPKAHFAKYAKDMQELDKLGLKLSSDPRNPEGGARESNTENAEGGGNAKTQD